jgi:hypothetical protein
LHALGGDRSGNERLSVDRLNNRSLFRRGDGVLDLARLSFYSPVRLITT